MNSGTYGMLDKNEILCAILWKLNLKENLFWRPVNDDKMNI